MNGPLIPVVLNGLSGAAVILILLGLGFLLLIFVVLRTVRHFLQQVRLLTLTNLPAYLQRSLAAAETVWQDQAPVSLANMERIYGPQIQADFPELNLEELRQRVQQLAYSTLTAIEDGNPARLSEDSEAYTAQLRQYLESLASNDQRERFAPVTIHQTVLSSYQKSGGTCQIGYQLAVGAHYQKTGTDRRFVADGEATSQFKIEIEALYIQDPEQFSASTPDVLAFHCPNCGAPIVTLGERQCAYCGSALEPVNRKVWTFSRFRLVLP